MRTAKSIISRNLLHEPYEDKERRELKAILNAFQNKFKYREDIYHEVLSYSNEFSRYETLYLHVPVDTFYKSEYVKKRFGDLTKVENIEAQIFYMQRTVRNHMTKY